MPRQEINPQVIAARGHAVVQGLQAERARQREAPARFSPDIEVVFILSGPGTYDKPLLTRQEAPIGQDQPIWMSWMDHDRILAGVGIVSEITAAKMRTEGIDTVGKNITKEHIARYGPLVVYNGFHVENESLRASLQNSDSKLPSEKVVIIDDVEDNGLLRQHLHTGDQLKSFYDAVRNPNSRLYGIQNVALVSHMGHMIRTAFYTALYNRKHIDLGNEPLRFWAYTVNARNREIEAHYIAEELPKISTYAERGDLATEPVPFENIHVELPPVHDMPVFTRSDVTIDVSHPEAS